MEYLAQFHNHEDNMTAVVFESKNKAGGFAVALRDDDSGNFAPITIHGIQSYDLACKKAKEMSNAC